MNHFTESACNRCDRRCRAGVYLGHKHAATACPTGGAPDFAVPCLLEITGPANVRGHCVLGVDRKPVWHRVTS